jgi:hypothetical protein
LQKIDKTFGDFGVNDLMVSAKNTDQKLAFDSLDRIVAPSKGLCYGISR